MKSFWTAVVIAVFLIGGGIMFNKHIDSVTDEMIEKEKKVSELIEREDFEKAEKEKKLSPQKIKWFLKNITQKWDDEQGREPILTKTLLECM